MVYYAMIRFGDKVRIVKYWSLSFILSSREANFEFMVGLCSFSIVTVAKIGQDTVWSSSANHTDITDNNNSAKN